MFADAVNHHMQGNSAEAKRLYQRVLAVAPRHAGSLHQMGMIAYEAGQLDAAIGLIAQAVAERPDEAWFLSNLGVVLQKRGRLDEAAELHRRAIALQPDNAEAHNNLGAVLHQQGLFPDAYACYRRALEIAPDYVDALTNLGAALKAGKKYEDALACQRRAVELRPDYAEAHNNLGNALKELGRFEEAAASYERALALQPDSVITLTNQGIVLRELGRLDEEYACYAKAMTRAPDFPEAHWNHAFALMADGDFIRGWAEYEWRWRRTGARTPVEVWPHLALPFWAGDAGNGRTILLWSEQGLGDCIQFARYAPLVQELGWRVILEVPDSQKSLLDIFPGITVLGEGEDLPPVDMQCPLLSLPRLLGTTVETVPAAVPYLHPDPGLAAGWANRLAPYSGFRVGVVWRGNPLHHRDRQRSMAPRWFSSCLDLPGLDVISLQVGAQPDEIAALGDGGRLLDASPHLFSYAESAALIANLDLVVSVDTSVAHLAGALGKPVWALLDSNAEWRWMRHREDTPWYPTMRLFRQTTIGDWSAVMQSVRTELLKLIP
jgi:tetratricopeptide (TPR) repeat protein